MKVTNLMKTQTLILITALVAATPAFAQSINPRTGEFYPGIGGGGSLNPRTGEVYPGIGGGGSFNPSTGAVYPGIRVPNVPVPGGSINPSTGEFYPNTGSRR
jgi:hypothetical protein